MVCQTSLFVDSRCSRKPSTTPGQWYRITIQLMISWDHPGFHRIYSYDHGMATTSWITFGSGSNPGYPNRKHQYSLGFTDLNSPHLPPRSVVCRRFWTILIHPHLSLTPGKRPTDRWRFRLFQCALGAPAVGPNEVSLPGVEQNWNKLKVYHGLHR